MSDFQFLNPPGWKPAKGYSNGVVAEGRTVFVAGQIGWTAEAKLVGDDFVAQVERALTNIVAVLAEAGGRAGAHHAAHLVHHRQGRLRGAPAARSARPTGASSAGISRP